ncbi:MAG: hypothetical protein K0Q96_102 [Rubrobacteraceae bacterium]|nr:hypothetical protein [Rubrobacteraceae bacterium]
MRRQSLRCLRGEGVRCLGRLHDSHQGQSQKERLNRIERPILPGKGLPRRASSGEEMGGGADDFLAHQASQPAHALVQEPRVGFVLVYSLVGLVGFVLVCSLVGLGGQRLMRTDVVGPLLRDARTIEVCWASIEAAESP